MKITKIGLLLVLALSLAACGGGNEDTTTTASADQAADVQADASAVEQVDAVAAEQEEVTVTDNGDIITASGLTIRHIEQGTGNTPQAGELVSVHYVGTLEDGTEFDSSYGRGEPITFPLGQGRVIAGWDEGIGMIKEGGKATLIIPPSLGYGDAGAGGVIPGGATLIFDVELVKILAGSPAAPQEVAQDAYTVSASGLKTYDIEVGTGDVAEDGDTVSVHYTGWLTDGTKFDSSLDRGAPFSFPIGAARVIAGWEEGVQGMKVGGKRQLVIPAELGYGDRGAGGIIPGGATLIFEVELLGTQ